MIRQFGILNTHIDPGKRSYGIPNPGLYFIDQNLVVTDKHFEKSYAARPTAESILVMHFDQEPKERVQYFQTEYLRGNIGISDSTARSGQVLAVVVNLTMKNGFHLYGTPIPSGYIPLTIKMGKNPNVKIDNFQFPPTRALVLKSLNETFQILPGKIQLKSSLRIKKKPVKGSHPIKFKISFQACDDKSCKFPEEFEFKFPVLIY